MLKKSLIEFIFEASSIERWNDHIRPSRGFCELDKQAHKMIYAYTLSSLCDDIDKNMLARGCLFEFLHRLVLTDIKPPVFHRLTERKGEQINSWVISSLRENLCEISGDFFESFKEYYKNPAFCEKEKRLLECAHYLATKWEFDIIYPSNSVLYGIDKTHREIELKLESFQDLEAFSRFMRDENLKGFTNLLGQLRFQQRWSKTPRLPATSVMGHMLIVAAMSYFCSLEIGAALARCANNFFGGLFHDVPEVLTRDIVSPVKNSVEGLDEIIKEIEDMQMKDVIYPLVSEKMRREIEYFTQNEFASKIVLDGKVILTSSAEINKKYNDAAFCPVDGEIIRACDIFGAYIETFFSHSAGVTSPILRDANRDTYKAYKNAVIGGFDFGKLFSYFKI